MDQPISAANMRPVPCDYFPCGYLSLVVTFHFSLLSDLSLRNHGLECDGKSATRIRSKFRSYMLAGLYLLSDRAASASAVSNVTSAR